MTRKIGKVRMAQKKQGVAKGRGPRPSVATLMALCARSAGRCQFMGCNRVLFRDPISLTTFNNTNVAHIVASSQNGARGDKQCSHELSDKLDNLMLMCPDHHKLVDEHPADYPVGKLRKMKLDQERAVESACESLNVDQSQILILTSKIKNQQTVSVSKTDAIKAMLPTHRPFEQTVSIDIESGHFYRDDLYWRDVEMSLRNQYDSFVASAVKVNRLIHFSVFPLAPIPLIMKLGFLMGDKVHSEIYQYRRHPNTWNWQKKNSGAFFLECRHQPRKQGKGVALIFSLSAPISAAEKNRFADLVKAKYVYELCADKPSVDCISTRDDLAEFWHAYQRLVEHIRIDHPRTKEVSVYAAVPVSAAFEIGRRYMPGIYPHFRVYDKDYNYCETLTIGGADGC